MPFGSTRSRHVGLVEVAVAVAVALAGVVLCTGVATAQTGGAVSPRPAASSVLAPTKHHDKNDDKDDDKDKKSKKKKDKKDGSDVKGAAKSASPCDPTAKACVDLTSHQAWLTDGAGHVTYGPVPAQGGSTGAKTPTGTFQVLSKDANYFSNEFKAPMPYSVFFYPGDAFHAGNTGAASNGCVHLAMGSAQRFFSALNPGDSVQVTS
jgi:lipoprotein-anchoring transpeptidase ErfK/SrfK